MFKQFTKQLFKASCNVIVFQLVAMPIAISGPTLDAINKAAPQESTFRTIGDVTMGAAQVFSQGVNSYVNAQNGAGSSQYEMHRVTLNPLLALQPISASQISPIFAGCAVLPASAPLLGGSMSCEKAPVQKIKSGYGNAVIDIATANIKQLENFNVEGHDTFNSQGKGCYNNAIKNFNKTLLEREKAVEAKIKFFEEQLDQFKFNAKVDLDEIKKRTAELTGKPAKYLEKDKKLENQLLSNTNDPNNVCSSIMPSSKFASGAKSGLEGILKNIETVATVPTGKGLTAQGMLDKSRDLEKEINRISNLVSSGAANNSDLNASTSGMNFNSSLISKDNAALKRVIANYNTEITTETSQLKKKLGITKGSLTSNSLVNGIISGIEADNINVDSRLKNFEKQTKQQCITRVIKSNFKTPRALGRRFVNPNVSKSLRDKADNALAIKIENLFDFTDPGNSYSIEDALALLKQFESKGGNQNYTMQTGKSMTVNGKELNASTRLRSSQLLEMFVDNCNQQYKTNTNEDGYSSQDIVNNLKSYSEKVGSMRKSAPTKIRMAIRDNMKNCPNDKSTGSSENSCSSAMDTNQPNFCLRTAVKCASNMNGCMAKAQAKVEEVRGEQTKHVENYKGHVNKFKATLLAELKGMDNFVSQQANALNAQLNSGDVFGITDMKFKLGEEQLLAAKDGITDDLAMEDPEKYFNMAKEQMKSLKKKMEDQRVSYVGNSAKGKINYLGQGSLGKTASNYVQNYSSQIGDWQKMITACNGKMQNVAKAQAEANKKKQENNETIAKACDELRAFNAAPECDTAGDLMTTVLQASRLASVNNGSNPMNAQMAQYHDQQAMETLGSIQKGCLQKGSGGDEKSAVSAPGGAGGINPSTFCSEVTEKKDNQYTELWADGGAKRTCVGFLKLNSLKVIPCKSKTQFMDNLRGSRVVCSNGSSYEFEDDAAKCTATLGYKVTSNMNKAYDNMFKDQAIDDSTAEAAKCYMQENPPTSIASAYEYVRSYNDYRGSTIELGETIKVSACNGGANGMIGMKGGWADMAGQSANEIGRALGSTRQ
jgi:hypothetical protein